MKPETAAPLMLISGIILGFCLTALICSIFAIPENYYLRLLITTISFFLGFFIANTIVNLLKKIKRGNKKK